MGCADITNATKPNHARRRWGELLGCSLAYQTAGLFKQNKSSLLLIAADTTTANELYTQLQFFLGDDRELSLFPNYETLPYDQFSPDENILAKRLSVLHKISTYENQICIVSIPTLLQRLPPRTFMESNCSTLSPND